MRKVGQDINTSLGRATSGLNSFSAGIDPVRGQLTALSVGAGLLSGLGIKTAASFEEVNIQLVGMTGSLDAATALTEKLRKDAARAGLPFADMLQMAKQLLPSLEGSTDQLESWAKLVRRVAVLNPQEGLAGAAFRGQRGNLQRWHRPGEPGRTLQHLTACYCAPRSKPTGVTWRRRLTRC